MNIRNSIKKRVDRLLKVKFDKETGFYRHQRFGKWVYVRHPTHLAGDDGILWLCNHLFFHNYLPKNNDVVVDLGAGYGDEAIFLAGKSPDVTYIGVEAQPVIFECLANTFRQLGEKFIASPYAITDTESLKFVSHFSYAAVGGIPEGYIEVPTIKWADFLQRYKIDHIDLFKMNIEGAEKYIIQGIEDFSFIKRFIISCHDFRANNGDGEWFRTKETVTAILKENGYIIKPFESGVNFVDDWVYAERKDL
ncbi:MAG: FkbM family methyltransferase [Gammaproteobacteria bacterium]|nr:FkbM family methyltransferase [Gammaproteobacteria bacterium]